MYIFLRDLSISACLGLRLAFLRMLTGLVVSLPADEVRARIRALSLADQALLIGLTLAGLLQATMLFAEAGAGGPLALWVAIWMVLR
ncbi:hypothetical protein [Tropicimonas sp. IMCC6043]|uniref:hypothetical protein n=1 Tax=Tropicimonas sp. IMCC6043 TaxID=2510645 RepID=UPI00101C17A9|nr:hypothetical protein [Tropicimonas sp. IMCC6043]RYH12026.1 hypothetical protein EU800_00190 [Tropicimonas sp. IMCC6043]